MSNNSPLCRLEMLSLSAVLSALLPCVLAAQDRDRREPESRERETEQRESEPRVDLSKPFAEVLENKRPLDSVFIEVSWRRGNDMVSTQIYGNGTGIWNHKAQFRLTRDQIHDLLESFQKTSFLRMASLLGEETDMLKLQGKIVLTIGHQTQAVHQLAFGDQSQELTDLANEILELAEAKGRDGVFVTDLSDGLKKIRSGKLAPEALQISAVRRNEQRGGGDPADTEDGWILRVAGRRAEAQLYRASGGYDTAREATLTEAEFKDLLSNVLRADPADLPRNAYAAQYTDLRVEVLDRVRDVAARRYSDVTPDTHKGKQKKFDRLYSDLRQLTRKILENGRVAPAAD
jgi:hypothetical protein